MNTRWINHSAFFILHSVFFILPFCPATSPAATYLTQAEALARAFPDAEVERKGYVLTEAQMEQAADLAGKPLPSALAAATWPPGRASWWAPHTLTRIASIPIRKP